MHQNLPQANIRQALVLQEPAWVSIANPNRPAGTLRAILGLSNDVTDRHFARKTLQIGVFVVRITPGVSADEVEFLNIFPQIGA